MALNAALLNLERTIRAADIHLRSPSGITLVDELVFPAVSLGPNVDPGAHRFNGTVFLFHYSFPARVAPLNLDRHEISDICALRPLSEDDGEITDLQLPITSSEQASFALLSPITVRRIAPIPPPRRRPQRSIPLNHNVLGVSSNSLMLSSRMALSAQLDPPRHMRKRWQRQTGPLRFESRHLHTNSHTGISGVSLVRIFLLWNRFDDSESDKRLLVTSDLSVRFFSPLC